jgi:hypothetical protein
LLRYNKDGFTWDNSEGHMTWDGKTPFKPTVFEPYLGAHELNTTAMDGYLTNSQLWALLAPKGGSIDYVYDQVKSLGSILITKCQMEPCFLSHLFEPSFTDDDLGNVFV